MWIPMKDRGKCTSSNKINGDFGQISMEQTMYKYYRPLKHGGKRDLNFNILLKPFLLNPPAQKFYITHNKVMTIENLVDILCTTEYYHS